MKRKRIMICLFWNVALYPAETWTLSQTEEHSKRLKCVYAEMEKFSWLEEVTKESKWRQANAELYWQRKTRWIGHVLKHHGLLHELTEGRMRGKPTRGRRRIQMLHDLANDGGYVAVIWAAKDTEGGDREKGCQKLWWWGWWGWLYNVLSPQKQ